ARGGLRLMGVQPPTGGRLDRSLYEPLARGGDVAVDERERAAAVVVLGVLLDPRRDLLLERLAQPAPAADPQVEQSRLQVRVERNRNRRAQEHVEQLLRLAGSEVAREHAQNELFRHA